MISPEGDHLWQSSCNKAHTSMALQDLQSAFEHAAVDESAYHELSHVQSALFY
jgi:hypothetical protein